MIKFLIGLIPGLALATIIAACGGGESSDNNGPISLEASQRVVQVTFDEEAEAPTIEVTPSGLCKITTTPITPEERTHTSKQGFNNTYNLGEAFQACLQANILLAPLPDWSKGQVLIDFKQVQLREIQEAAGSDSVIALAYSDKEFCRIRVAFSHTYREVVGHEVLHCLPPVLPWCGGSYHKNNTSNPAENRTEECLEEGLHNVE